MCYVFIIIRNSIYQPLKTVLESSGITFSGFVNSLIISDYEFLDLNSNEYKKAIYSINELREIGAILNLTAAQINANSKPRIYLDSEMMNIISSILEDLEKAISVYRNINFEQFKIGFTKVKTGDFQKKNHRKNMVNKWLTPKIKISKNDKVKLISDCKIHNYTLNKYINRLIYLAMNQGNFYDNRTKYLLKNAITQLNKIIVNLNQIYYNRKNQALGSEVEKANILVSEIKILKNLFENDVLISATKRVDLDRLSNLDLLPPLNQRL